MVLKLKLKLLKYRSFSYDTTTGTTNLENSFFSWLWGNTKGILTDSCINCDTKTLYLLAIFKFCCRWPISTSGYLSAQFNASVFNVIFLTRLFSFLSNNNHQDINLFWNLWSDLHPSPFVLCGCKYKIYIMTTCQVVNFALTPTH